MTAHRLLVVALLLGVSAGILASPRLDSIGATVTRDVIALDDDGLPITDLLQSEIEVLSDGAPVHVIALSPAPRELNVVLIVDATMSQPLKRYEIQNAVAGIWMQNLLPGDRARVGMLGSVTTLGPWFSADRVAEATAVRAMIGRAESEASPIWDAVALAVQALDSTRGSKALLLLTDGRATANRIGLDDAIRLAQAANVSVSVVSEGGERVLPQGADPTARIQPSAGLEALAGATGGVFLPDGVARRTLRPQEDPFAYVRELAQTPNRPGPLLAKLTSLLRQRYRLTFDGAADGQTHRLDVRTRRPGVTIKAPRSYRAGVMASAS